MQSVRIRGLGKRYRLGEEFGYGSLREAVMQRLTRAERSTGRDFWAFRDVSFDIDEGEVLGIVGRNGAGKSTLLKVVSRITDPTEGTAAVRGRVGALLEVGTGFHPELTGRENIWLNGALLGMTRQRIRSRFDDIVEFAGVTTFLDTPIKRYSSGMQLRLAFSVAAHLEPDVVVIDEVLAVGDAEFQRKCLGKVSELHDHGRTVLFVSHDLGAVGSLCDRVIWLDRGGVKADGPTHEVLDAYLHTALSAQSDVTFPDVPDRPVAPLRVWLTDEQGTPVEVPRRDRPVVVRVRLSVHQPIVSLDVAVYLLNRAGVRVLDEAWSDTGGDRLPVMQPGLYELAATIPPMLTSGEYVLGVWIGNSTEVYLEREVMTFSLAPRPDDLQEAVERSRVVIAPTGWAVTPMNQVLAP